MLVKKRGLNSAIEDMSENAGNLKYFVTCVRKKLRF